MLSKRRFDWYIRRCEQVPFYLCHLYHRAAGKGREGMMHFFSESTFLTVCDQRDRPVGENDCTSFCENRAVVEEGNGKARGEVIDRNQ